MCLTTYISSVGDAISILATIVATFAVASNSSIANPIQCNPIDCARFGPANRVTLVREQACGLDCSALETSCRWHRLASRIDGHQARTHSPKLAHRLAKQATRRLADSPTRSQARHKANRHDLKVLVAITIHIMPRSLACQSIAATATTTTTTTNKFGSRIDARRAKRPSARVAVG